MQKLILKCGLSAGDIVMLTAALRDLHHRYPGQFLTDVRTCYPELWEHNPHVTPLSEADPQAKLIHCSYPLINHCDRQPHHCLEGFIDFLNRRLELNIQLTAIRGDIHLSERECAWYSQVHEVTRRQVPFWIIDAGGKYDVTIKWWEQGRYQEVVDHFRGRVQFVQVGAAGHHHPRLEGVIDLRGRTNLRELIRLVYHADGVLCPITALMHLAAAVPPKSPAHRACVVVAGGREPAHWESYPGHQFIHTIGALACCRSTGCWKDRVVPLRDGDRRDHSSCRCVDLVAGLPRCLDLITAAEVIRRIEWYYAGGMFKPLTRPQQTAAQRGVVATLGNTYDQQPLNIHSAGSACERFVSQIPAYPADRFEGRGIVICAGAKPFPEAWNCIRNLRRLRCELPIELWHLGHRGIGKRMRAQVERLGVTCVDAVARQRIYPARRMFGWNLKSYALLHSRFREVLYLDAAHVAGQNPEPLFNRPAFRKTGSLFWRGLNRCGQDNSPAIWRSCGLRPPREPELETSRMLLDKQRCWKALCLASWFNEQSDFYYRHLGDDAEIFHLAFRKLRRPYTIALKARNGFNRLNA